MRRRWRARRRTTSRRSPSSRPIPLAARRRAVRSSGARNRDAPLDDLRAQRLNARSNRVGDQRAVVLVEDVADPLLLQAELIDAALERAVLHPLDRLKHGLVDALDHRREDVSRSLRLLVGID